MKYLNLFIMILVFTTSSLLSRDFRPSQIPNGQKYRCSNCHINPNGGGPWTPFGSTVRNNYLDGQGNVMWNAELAALDSDGDGFTNGQELQDPEGTWKIGDPDPGDPSLVSKPGDPNSTPPVSGIEEFALKTGFHLRSVSPNPVNENSSISYYLKNSGILKIQLFSTDGKLVKNIDYGMRNNGEYNLNWDASNISASGVYFLRFTFNGLSYSEKIILSK